MVTRHHSPSGESSGEDAVEKQDAHDDHSPGPEAVLDVPSNGQQESNRPKPTRAGQTNPLGQERASQEEFQQKIGCGSPVTERHSGAAGNGIGIRVPVKSGKPGHENAENDVPGSVSGAFSTNLGCV
ncbi:hypothetical protein N7451_001685 [Penicillium sp. IBT 35674x]|nr:hypothetical protein N7451_001685 [Penicillium sp. IBT 35674x]